MEAAPNTGPDRPSYVLYVIFGRLLPFLVFCFFVAIQLKLFQGELGGVFSTEPTLGRVGFLLNRVMSLGFASGVALIYVTRRPPKHSLHDPISVIVSMYASFVLLALRPVAAWFGIATLGDQNPLLLNISNLLVVLGVALSLYALFYLKLNFSILPEARAAVTSGPYRLVRHPVYLGEIVSGLGLVIALPSVLTAVTWVTFVAAQLVRTRLEERVLSTFVHGYSDYAKRTKRLIPFLV